MNPGDPPSAEQVIRRAEASGFRSPAQRRPARNRFVHYGGWTAAAVAGFALWNALADSPESVASGSPASQEFITTSGETAMVRLEDGSLIRLGPGSRLTTAVATGSSDQSPSSFSRQVTLHGAALIIARALDQLLAGTDLGYVGLGSQVVVVPRVEHGIAPGQDGDIRGRVHTETTLTGIVRDSVSLEPVAFARVTVTPLGGARHDHGRDAGDTVSRPPRLHP